MMNLQKKSINLLPLLKRAKKPPLPMLTRIAIYMGGGCVLILCVLLTAYFVQIGGINQDIKALNAYLEDEAQIAAYYEAFESRERDLVAHNKALQANAVYDRVNSVPKLYAADFAKIEEFCGNTLDITQFTVDANARVAQIDLQGQNAEDIAPFVSKLKESGLFEDVDYVGYSSTSGGYYKFRVSGTMKDTVIDTVAAAQTDAAQAAE